jgi:hypothetical protein
MVRDQVHGQIQTVLDGQPEVVNNEITRIFV